MHTARWMLGLTLLLIAATPLYATFTAWQGDATQEAAWQAAVGQPIPIETFESYTGVPGPGTGGDLLASLPALNVTFDSPYPSVYEDGFWAHSGSNQWSNWSDQAGNAADHVLRPDPGSSIYALGFWNCDPQGSQPMLAYDFNDQLVGTIVGAINTHGFDPANSTGFAGFISTIPIAYIVIPGNFGDGWNHFDDLQVLTTPNCILGDTDGDADVDFDDFLSVNNFFGDTGPDSPGDADCDGDSDFDDFLAVNNFFGTPAPGSESPGIAIPGSSSLTFVPEPASFSLLAFPACLSTLSSRPKGGLAIRRLPRRSAAKPGRPR